MVQGKNIVPVADKLAWVRDHFAAYLPPEQVEQRVAIMSAGLVGTPEQITDEVMKIIGLRKLKPFYLVGSDARPMGMMRRLLSDSAFEKIIRGVYKIPSPKP